MKQVFYKTAFLLIATSFVGAFTGTTSNACGKKFCCQSGMLQKPSPHKKTVAASAENTEHLDFIVTNSILRF
jgi:hypothetical protein